MTRRLSGLLLIVIAVVLVLPAPAQADVEILTIQTNGDKTITLTFAMDHSCEGSPTTELTVTVPPEVTPSGATGPSGWSASVNDNQVRWSGPGVEYASDFRFVASIIARPEQTLLFPTVQRCADGNLYAWTDGRPDDEHPAPRLIVTTPILAGQPQLRAPSPTITSATNPDIAGRGPVLAVLTGFVLVAAAIGHQLAGRGRADTTDSPDTSKTGVGA